MLIETCTRPDKNVKYFKNLKRKMKLYDVAEEYVNGRKYA